MPSVGCCLNVSVRGGSLFSQSLALFPVSLWSTSFCSAANDCVLALSATVNNFGVAASKAWHLDHHGRRCGSGRSAQRRQLSCGCARYRPTRRRGQQRPRAAGTAITTTGTGRMPKHTATSRPDTKWQPPKQGSIKTPEATTAAEAGATTTPEETPNI